MPYKFTPLEPIQYHEFDFNRFIEDTIHNSVLQQITFVQEWKACWLYVLLEEDEYVKKCIKMRPDTNPLLEKINANPQLRGMENEIFVYEMNSLHGDTFLFHFDVNKMRNFTLTYRLTKREREVFLYLVKGYRNKEIADTLHLSEYTIKNHIDSILNKLDAKSRLEVIVKFA